MTFKDANTPMLQLVLEQRAQTFTVLAHNLSLSKAHDFVLQKRSEGRIVYYLTTGVILHSGDAGQCERCKARIDYKLKTLRTLKQRAIHLFKRG